MSDEPGKTYEVGYKKPPQATRFQKGKSGNPSGLAKERPQSLDLGTMLEAIDNEEIVILQNGKRKRMTKIEVEYLQLYVKASKGDLAAAYQFIKMAMKPQLPGQKDSWNYEFIGETEAAKRFGKNWRRRVDELNASRGFGV